MIVSVKISFPLRRYISSSVRRLEGDKCDMTMTEGTKVFQVLQMLNIPEEEAKIILVNGHRVDKERVLNDGDLLHFFPQLCGG